MADFDNLLSTILSKQEPRQQQFRDELAAEDRRKNIGTIRQGSFYDDNIAPFVNMIKPDQYSNQPNINPETGAPDRGMGDFLTSGFGNTASNTLSTADALSMLLMGGAGIVGGKKFLTGLGEKGNLDTNSLKQLMEKLSMLTRGRIGHSNRGLSPTVIKRQEKAFEDQRQALQDAINKRKE